MTLAGQAPAGQPTPGPWTFLEDGDAEALHNCRPLTICSPSKDDLAEVFSEEDSTVAIPRQQAIANARLIASSPSLLQAAQDAYLQMLRVSDQRTRVTLSYQGALCQLRDSIAAATGRDSQAVQEEYEARATGSQP